MKTLIKKILREEENVGTVIVLFPGLMPSCGFAEKKFLPNTSKKVLCFEAHASSLDKAIQQLKKLKYDRLEVIGHSAGGVLAMRLANKIKVDSLVLLDPAVLHDWSIKNFPSDSTLLYNMSGENVIHKGTYEDLPKVAEEMQNKGMHVENLPKVAHGGFPNYYFKKFYSEDRVNESLIKKILNEFKIDELSRKDYRDGEIVMEYIEGHDYPRYALYYDVQLEEKDEYEMIAEFDSRFFDAGMVETITDYLKSRQ